MQAGKRTKRKSSPVAVAEFEKVDSVPVKIMQLREGLQMFKKRKALFKTYS
jgi:hypothetical protein